MKTLKFISIEHPLKFYGIPGIVFLAIGLIFTIMTIQGFTETRQILLSTSILTTKEEGTQIGHMALIRVILKVLENQLLTVYGELSLASHISFLSKKI